MSKKFLFLIPFVLMLGLTYTCYGAPGTIWLDFDDANDVNTQHSLTSFLISNSGSTVNGITIDLGGSIDDRRRVDPNGRPFDEVYRDFIFGISPSAVTITLWGLGVEQDCNITLWAYDNQSEPNRIADWTATWGDVTDVNYIFTTDFNGGVDDPNNWPAGDGSTNYVGIAKADGLGRIMLTCTRGPNSPGGLPFAFVNALKVEPKGAFIATNYPHRPQPADGAQAVPVDTLLKWGKGGLSNKRDVYLGTNFDNVNDANRSNPLGVLVSQNQDANSFDPSAYLEVGKSYYWRIDEVNTTTSTFWTGKVWTFNTFVVGEPIAWWKLDETSGSTAYDSSGNNYHAAINGDPVWRTGSPYGGSGYLDFDGDGDWTDADYLDSNNIQLPDLYTVTLWFKCEGGSSNRDMFAAVGSNNGHGILLELRGDDTPPGRIRYIHRSPVQPTGVGFENTYTPAGYADNLWHHIAIVRASGSSRTIYIDGEPVITNTDGIAGFDRPLRINLSTLRPDTPQRYWNGGIDDVRIYNSALSQTEIREVMRSRIASGPQPPDGATDVELTPTLSWMAGIYAASVNGHKLYLDPDRQKVVERSGCQINGVVTTDPCYGPIGPLGVGKTHYWAVDEVNGVDLWAGDIWSFKTTACIMIEDFDSYGSTDELRDVWKDFFTQEAPKTSAECYQEMTTVRSGNSMRYWFRNYTYSPYYSEVRATVADLAVDSDWSDAGALSIWFYGNAGNDPCEPMYVKLTDGSSNDANVYYDGAMSDIRKEEWQEWVIDMSLFSGVNLANISQITIGIGDGSQAANDGTIYIDDIALCASKCALSKRNAGFALVDFAPLGYSASGDCMVDNQELTIMVDDWLAEDDIIATQNPGEVNLVAYYPLNEGDGNNVEDVVGDHNGILAGDVSWITPGFIGSSAIHVPYTAGSRVDINNWNPVGNWDPCTNTGDLTLAVWAKWAGTTGEEQGLITKRDDFWDANGIMFGLDITGWPFATTSMLALRGNTDVTSGNVTMGRYLGRWTHLAAAVDGNAATLYINGQEVASGAFTFDPNADASMAIGNVCGVNGGETTQTFNGDLDEVRIYNRALTPSEIAYIADTTPLDGWLTVPVPSPAEVWKGEPEGQRIINFRDFAMIANLWLEEDMYP
ncbi:MAG: LamG domain-containing protein [Sedimentisphaerales bacterium]|nr:LamG domain-containing protein [Sedimentisphaerales bacterium]